MLEGAKNLPANVKFKDLTSIGKSSVTVTCKSLKGQLYCFKANEFLRQMRLDPSKWKIFETHCERKNDETVSRVAQMKNILEDKYEELNNPDLKSQALMLGQIRDSRTAARPKRIFGQRIKSQDDYMSTKTVGDFSDNK